jgi:glycerophosphoryl diester phosphodiesterase
VKQLYPEANGDPLVWVQPGITAEQVKEHHSQGRRVIANFSANDQEMDLTAMKAAVAAGVDGINVDYPRLGADAVGRPAEQKLALLAGQANGGESGARAQAILELARYRGFALQEEFTRWLLDPNDHVSRAAAVALVTARPRTSPATFVSALRSDNLRARANAAWALGALQAPAKMLLPLLQDEDPQVLAEALIALSHMPGEVSVTVLLPLLTHPDPEVRGAAAVALARHQPDMAAQAVPAQLRTEMKAAQTLYDDWVRRGKAQLAPAEIDTVMGYYRCQMKQVQAISMLHGPVATEALEEQAFRPGADFSQVNAVVAAFQLWGRIGADPRPALQALGAADIRVADKAEWMLIQGGPSVLPLVREAIGNEHAAVRRRAIQIVAWQGDIAALQRLRRVERTDPQDAELAKWAIEKIETLHPKV